MEAVLKNFVSTVELLAVAAHSGMVKQWDEQTLSRAFHWAKYCEHIYSRFHNNPAIRGVMENQLHITNRNLRDVIPGYSDVSFSDLPRFQHLLLVGLLNNPNLPSTIMKILFDKKIPVNVMDNEYEDITGFCSHIVQCKSVCKVLRPLSSLSAVGVDAEMQGEMLMKKLDALLSQGNDLSQAEDFLYSLHQLFEGAAPHFSLVIASALLTTEDFAAQTSSQGFLLDWLQNQHSVLQHMCSMLPSTLLKDLSKRHKKFRDAYYCVLKKCASEMEYSISDGEWVQTGTTSTVSFQKMAEHFLALFEACPSLKRSTEDELNALKISDGDFDVRGLSVWGDLLSELSK
ncbi:Fanconi anemia group F protein [Melanotaenia boesemani]|uniref:Fanconi anemia group F protein n=1 Tax=Melanotaenia boesemani TaxID=1250792 RepID=UPI001C043F1E|nr:Fanconi anemia group F protein [Melanotaenia boesemani]